MLLDITTEGGLLLEEVFNPVVLRTAAGLDLSICMRDDGYEISVGRWGGPSSAVKRYAIDCLGAINCPDCAEKTAQKALLNSLDPSLYSAEGMRILEEIFVEIKDSEAPAGPKPATYYTAVRDWFLRWEYGTYHGQRAKRHRVTEQVMYSPYKERPFRRIFSTWLDVHPSCTSDFILTKKDWPCR